MAIDGESDGLLNSVDAIAEMEPAEAALLELINAARKNPLIMAESMGMEQHKILKDFPELKEILTDGLPELQNNRLLHQSAGNHTQDMIENSYYAYDSLDGKSYDQRIIRQGYRPSTSGECLGLIFFNNFISPDQAALQIFENMYRDELNPDLDVVQNILNPEFREIGISIEGGIFRLSNGFSANAYMAVCDFARPVEIYEMQLFNLINQLRADPQPVLAEYGIDASIENFPELESLLTDGLQPLAYESSLYTAADILVDDMFDNHHFKAKTADGRTLEDRMTEVGYTPAWSAESRFRLSTCDEFVSPLETVSQMFRYLVNRAFQADPERRNAAMLSSCAEDCGIRIVAGQSAELSGICGDDLHILVADFGTRLDQAEPETEDTKADYGKLIGLVYEDNNLDNLYNIGEELSGVKVGVKKGKDSKILYEVFTNNAGGYAIDLPRGRYQVVVENNSGHFSQWVEIKSGNATWLPMNVDSAI